MDDRSDFQDTQVETNIAPRLDNLNKDESSGSTLWISDKDKRPPSLSHSELDDGAQMDSGSSMARFRDPGIDWNVTQPMNYIPTQTLSAFASLERHSLAKPIERPTSTMETNPSTFSEGKNYLDFQQAYNTNALVHPNVFDDNTFHDMRPFVYDSTTEMPINGYQPRRRRVSLANGQISKLINYEASSQYNGLDDDNDEYEQFSPQQNNSPMISQEGMPFDYNVEGIGSGPNMLNVASTDRSIDASLHEPLVQAPSGAPKSTNLQQQGRPPTTEMPYLDHQFIYNNEIVPNPSHGPLPGSTAWKKERSLERNRIAAFKSRQRKRQAHQNLQETIGNQEKHIKELSNKVEKYEKVFERCKAYLSQRKEDTGSIFGLLKLFDDIDSLDIKDIQTLKIED